MRKPGLGFLFLIMLGFMMAGCSSVSVVKNSEVLRGASLSSYNSIDISVSSRLKNSSEVVKELKNEIVSMLKKEKLFGAIESGAALKLDVDVVKIRNVSGAARVLLGALAGRAKVYVKCSLVDTEKGVVLRRFEVEGESSGGSIFAGTTKQAVKKAAEAIVSYIKKKM